MVLKQTATADGAITDSCSWLDERNPFVSRNAPEGSIAYWAGVGGTQLFKY